MVGALRKCFFDDYTTVDSQRMETDFLHYIHATAVIDPEIIPLLINSLQGAYDLYLQGIASGGESDGQG